MLQKFEHKINFKLVLIFHRIFLFIQFGSKHIFKALCREEFSVEQSLQFLSVMIGCDL